MMSARPISRIAEGHHEFASKTPAKAQSRGENAYRGPATLHGKDKNILLHTPFNPSIKQIFNEKESTVSKPLAPLQPLLDRTPFPNRTGLLQQLHTPYGPSLDSTRSPDSLLRPSSLRQHIRAPRSSGTSKGFLTPANTRNPWDCDISIDSPELTSQELSTALECDDEVEYTAPNTLDLPYCPPLDFDLPNYKKVGESLRNVVHLAVYNDTPPPDPILTGDDLGISWKHMLEVPEPESNDPFHVLSKSMKPASIRPTVRSKTGLSSSIKTTPRAQSVLSTNRTSGSLRAPVRPGAFSSGARPVPIVKAKISRPATVLSSAQRYLSRAIAAKEPKSVVPRASATRAAEKYLDDTLRLHVAQSDPDDFMFAV